MKIKVKRIRDIIDKTIAADQKQFDAAYEKSLEAFTKRRADWIKKNNPKWKATVGILQAALREGTPITMEMLPVTGANNGRHSNYDLLYFNDDPPKKSLFQPSCHYKTALAILDLTDDDEIAIASLGVANVREIIETAQNACKPRKR